MQMIKIDLIPITSLLINKSTNQPILSSLKRYEIIQAIWEPRPIGYNLPITERRQYDYSI